MSRPRLLVGDIITVEVGNPPTLFKLHKSLLKESGSFFFKGALNGHFKESETKCIPLHDEDPGLFSELATWFYTGTITDIEDQLHWFDLSGIGMPGLPRLFRLWILGDKLQIPQFQNCVFQGIQKAAGHNPTWKLAEEWGHQAKQTLEFVFANTVSSSQIRCLAVDITVHNVYVHHDYLEGLSPEIVQVIATRACKFANPLLKRVNRDKYLANREYLVSSCTDTD